MHQKLVFVTKDCCKRLVFKHLCAQVSVEEPARAVEVNPLLVRYGEFFLGGALWAKYRRRNPHARLSDYLGKRYRRMRRLEKYLKDFFAHFDRSILSHRRRLRRRLRRARGEPNFVPKEEPIDEEPVDPNFRRYSFLHHNYNG